MVVRARAHDQAATRSVVPKSGCSAGYRSRVTTVRQHLGLAVGVALILGLALGVGTTIGVQVVKAELDSTFYSKTDPGAAIWQCDGAEVVAVAVLEDGIVHVRLSLKDSQHRRWELRESPYYGSTDLTPGDDGSYRSLNLADGDTDGGPRRQVSLRVAGTSDDWCTDYVSLV